jgi:hypothetical protein
MEDRGSGIPEAKKTSPLCNVHAAVMSRVPPWIREHRYAEIHSTWLVGLRRSLVSSEAAARATKTRDYCGEEILATAKKCRHCGEILDPAPRAAEKAKAMAQRHAQPLVINRRPSPFRPYAWLKYWSL